MLTRPALLALLALIAVCPAAVWSGQAAPPTPAPRPADDKPAATINLAALPPALRLGVRANFLQRQLGVIPTIVLVPDEASYIAAISAWSTKPDGAIRFPVLIDDGSWASQQRIMQFVRAFKPEAIVRWQLPADRRALPKDVEAWKTLIESAAAGVWGSTPAELTARWKAIGFEPAGVVVAWPEDPAWTAALALAASRGQPIVWYKPPLMDPSAMTDLGATDALSGAAMATLDKTGYAYRTLGDTIDAITICLNIPSKVWLGEKDDRRLLATTDVIGRAAKEPRRDRWAYASQIFGDSGRAAHDAMCGLFLLPESAWLLDGYDSTQPWINWDMTAAAERLRTIGLTITLDDAPGGATLPDLRARVAGLRGAKDGSIERGIDAGLIGMNTQGNPDFFGLPLGAGKPGDVPVLRRPAMAYVVHSFSVNQPGNRATIGGAFLSRGVYAYIGSVHEPFLQAFPPTPILMGRLAEGAAWAAAARDNDARVWKIAVFGDALITLGPQGPRLKAPLPSALAGSAYISESLTPLLKERKFAAAMRLLAIQGRDTDAARLCAAIAKDSPADFTPEVALAGIGSCFFAGDLQVFITTATACLPALRDDARVQREGLEPVRDMIWQALYPRLGDPTPQEADLLAAALRPDTLARDAAEGFAAMRIARGEEAARTLLTKARLMVKDRETSDAIDKIAR